MKVLLLADGPVGVAVAQHLIASGDRIEGLYLHPEGRRHCAAEIVAAAAVAGDRVYAARDAQDPQHIDSLRKVAPDFVITVYWAYLLQPEFYTLARDTVNFHPALLPVNRGWYPHVHSILDGSPCGVTLHRIEAEADTGAIWAQHEVPLREVDTADTIHARLQDAMIELFREHWTAIRDARIQPSPQDESRAVYHAKSEVNALDEIDLDAPTTARQVLRRLRARTFGERGFAYYRSGGSRIHVCVRLYEDSDV